MAEASPPVGSPPRCLWYRRPGIYEDDKGRTWVMAVLHVSPSHRAWGRGFPGSTVSHGHGIKGGRVFLQREAGITVHMLQMAVHPQMLRSQTRAFVSGLPLKWELYPGRKYQGTDSRLWDIVDHGQASARWPQINSTERLILTYSSTGDD
ncbi:T-cell leukemia/lymphoma protein 1B [Camelus dromedarius]|uniref:T-cell leukemia/lymphoma protein 1B n=1 Tax=Camelus dromedarius TaxID=9838 RepID=A0A5N4E2E1_CAMDR|nr:T-cell leukemia/lymphoma protein 1B [Camelus dromedarius]